MVLFYNWILIVVEKILCGKSINVILYIKFKEWDKDEIDWKIYLRFIFIIIFIGRWIWKKCVFVLLVVEV